MKRVLKAAIFGLIVMMATASTAIAASKCATCHQKENPGMYSQWKNSKHGQNDVGCIDCHQADKKDVDAFKHNGAMIAMAGAMRLSEATKAGEICATPRWSLESLNEPQDIDKNG